MEELNKKKPGRQNVLFRQVGANDGPRRLPLPPLKVVTAERQPLPQEDSFPGRKLAIDWVNRFFDMVAPVLPFVNKFMLVREIDLIDSRTGTWQSCPSNTQALMSIVFAHSLAISEDGAAEPFYRRALGLLDEKGLYLPTIEARKYLDPFTLGRFLPHGNTNAGQSKRCYSWQTFNRTVNEHKRASRLIFVLSKLHISLVSTRHPRTVDSETRTMSCDPCFGLRL